MLFTYKHIENHSIYALQKWVDDLFMDVWCKADPNVDYDIESLPQELKEVAIEIDLDPRITTDYFFGPFEKVYQIFQTLNKPTKEILAKAYRDNNCIKDLCQNQNGCKPYRYIELKKINEDLNDTLETFFKHLFTNVIGLKAVTDRIGKIESHYKDFVKVNDEDKCPFCGINDLKGQYVRRRDAYDHYLPKDIYPFNSINFYNLAPMCQECNSSYKGVKDPLLKKDKKTVTKAFYPYESKNPKLKLSFEVKKTDIDALEPNDIDIQVKNKKYKNQIESWMHVFGIEERYRAKCLAKNDGKYWFQQVTDEYSTAQSILGVKFSKEKWIEYQIRAAKNSPFAGGNHIKVAFLEAGQKNGMFPKDEKKGCLNTLTFGILKK